MEPFGIAIVCVVGIVVVGVFLIGALVLGGKSGWRRGYKAARVNASYK